MSKLLRVLFNSNEDDPRPVNWPVKHPYWITGRGEGYTTLVSYANSKKYILENWPEATDIDITEVDKYIFTDRFPCPGWFEKGGEE